MLESLFKGILNISLYATVIAFAVMFIKLICGKRLSPNFHYGIWFLFLFKLVFPFDIKSMLSIFTLFDRIAPEPVTEQINTVLPPITTGLFVQSANLHSPNSAAEMPVAAKGLDLWNVAAVLWITGIIIMLAALVFSYTKTSKILKTTSEKPDSRLLDILSICKTELNIRYNIPVYTTGSFGIPFIFGFFKPMIILPVHIYNKLPDAGIKAILLHELMHIKRKDYLVNLNLFLLKSVYWFNPIVWLSFAWMKNDAERACDSAVVKEYSTEKRGEYAKALLDVAASVGKRTYIPAISAFTEGNFKERIKNVLKGRRYSFMAAAIAVMVFIAAGVILLTGAQAKSETADYSTEAETEPSGAIIIDEPRIVIPNILEVNKTTSDYAHAQHLIWVEGRFKHTEGELYLTLLDKNSKPLESGGLRASDEVKRIDGEWSSFSHKLIEDSQQILDIDEAIILFELKQDGKSIKGQLTVPARKPVGIVPAGNGKQVLRSSIGSILYAELAKQNNVDLFGLDKLSTEERDKKLFPVKVGMVKIATPLNATNELLTHYLFPEITEAVQDTTTFSFWPQDIQDALNDKSKSLSPSILRQALTYTKNEMWEKQARILAETLSDNAAIAVFIEEVDNAFSLALSADDRKMAQSQHIFDDLVHMLDSTPPAYGVTNTQEAAGSVSSTLTTQDLKNMIEDINNKLLEGYKQVITDDAEQALDSVLITPKYLPGRFQNYGIFMRDDPGIPTQKMIKQLWYDPEKFEVLLVTQSKISAPNQEGRIIFTDGLEVPGKISDIYPWAKYRTHYEFTKGGISAQGYMLVNDEGNREEYERILKSLDYRKSNISFVITANDGDFPNSPDITALAPTDQADQKELEDLLPEIIADLYTEPGYEKYEGVHLERAADAGVFGEMVENWAGPEVAKSTWVVGLRFPAFDPSNSAGAGKFFVTKTRDGWEIWQRYH